jgi:queuine tRNA-ribosyltransferase
VLTDSGGYQVFSLAELREIDDDGVTFRSHLDGEMKRLTPEESMRVQALLGADVAMVLDECPPGASDRAAVEAAVRRTTAWAKRSLAAPRPPGQARFGIVQGAAFVDLRRAHLDEIAALPCDGVALGGFSVGETRAEMLPALAAALEHLPADRPRYLMGVGDPASLIEAVSLGVDQFDCVMQTRLGRHDTALTSRGRFQAKAARNAELDEPLDAECGCAVCGRHSRGYIRHLLQVGEPTASRLLSLHNVAWTIQLMTRMREAIGSGTFGELRREVLDVWE